MKGTLKAISAFLVAVVMSMSMGAIAFADDGLATTDNTATIKVNFTAAEGLTAPAFGFDYSIAAGQAQEADANHQAVYAGVGNPTITNATLTAGQGSTDIKVTVPAGTFNHAGIYRYEVTQAALSDEAITVGILNENGTGKAVTKLLDLYVDENGKVTGAALIKDLNANTKSAGFDNTFGKSAGGDPTDPTNPDDPDTPDIPEDKVGKHDVTFTKNIAGAMADANEVFNFDVTVTYAGTLDMSTAQWSIDGTKYNVGATATNGIQVKGGQSVTITVPNNMTVKVVEKTAAGEGYSITSTATAFNADATAITTAVNADTLGTGGLVKYADAAIAYLNTRETISPTGVALRYAPYLLIVAAGVAFLLVSRRRKADINA